jgi:hypothetical protein
MQSASRADQAARECLISPLLTRQIARTRLQRQSKILPLPVLTGRGWGEGFSPRAQFAESPPHPTLSERAVLVSAPQAGRESAPPPVRQRRCSFSLSPFFTGRGWGEGVLSESTVCGESPHPTLSERAVLVSAPQAGRGSASLPARHEGGARSPSSRSYGERERTRRGQGGRWPCRPLDAKTRAAKRSCK